LPARRRQPDGPLAAVRASVAGGERVDVYRLRPIMMDRTQAPLTRRDLLRRAGTGFGLLGLAGALDAAGLLGSVRAAPGANITPVTTGPHFPAKAKRVIFLFMNGGP